MPSGEATDSCSIRSDETERKEANAGVSLSDNHTGVVGEGKVREESEGAEERKTQRQGGMQLLLQSFSHVYSLSLPFLNHKLWDFSGWPHLCDDDA
jgi:hypothetical protein